MDLCLGAEEACDEDGEKAALVGEFWFLVGVDLKVPSSETFAGEGAIASNQGVS